MTPTLILQRIRDIGFMAWIRFVQALNVILVSLLGSALVIHQAYPGLVAGMIGKLPPAVGVPAIILLGVIIHYALRRAKASDGAKG
jgi:hypothetical protein